MKKVLLFVSLGILALACSGCKQKAGAQQPLQDDTLDGALPTVYVTRGLGPQDLIRIYEALGVEAKGNVGVKISTGEMGGDNYLHPELIGDFVKKVNGTLMTSAQGQETTKNIKAR